MNKKILTCLTVALVMIMSSCGKYEDGPFFSIRSKNARITGEWKLVKSERVRTSAFWDGSTQNYTWIFNGSTMSYTTSFNGTVTSSYSSTWEFDGDKNALTMKTTEDGLSSNITTIWNWENGSSKKEMLNIDGDLYRILRLTNKELVIESVYTATYESDNSKLTFEKK